MQTGHIEGLADCSVNDHPVIYVCKAGCRGILIAVEGHITCLLYTSCNGEHNYLILRNALMTRTVLNLNRSQLIILSILLTGIASVLAAVLSRQFSRPIFQIKRAAVSYTHLDVYKRQDSFWVWAVTWAVV